jgi:hypothetical protein
MQRSKRLITLFILLISFFACSDARSIVEFADKEYHIRTDGDTSYFDKGVVYRRDGFPIQIILRGTHYEMGLQRGVLLKTEIQYFAQKLYDFIVYLSKTSEIPENLIFTVIKEKSKKAVNWMPERFNQELRGISEGSGISVDVLNIITFFDDLTVSMACSGIISKTKEGKILHARNEDNHFGQFYGERYVIMKYQPDGFKSYVSIGNPGWIGVSTAYNQDGLQYSHNTRVHRGVNKKGMPHHIISRIALEECSSLDELMDVYNNYSGYIGASYLWSDIKTHKGILIENIEAEQSIYKITPLNKNNLWHVNRYVDNELAEKNEKNYIRYGFANTARSRIFADLVDPAKTYDIYEVIKILRTTSGPFSSVYYKEGLAWGICNLETHNLIIFDSDGNGFYMANGKSYGSCNAIYYFSNDFTKPPVLFLPSIKITACEKEIGKIEGNILTDEEKFYLYQELLQSYPKISILHFLAGTYAFKAGLLSKWVEHIERARELSPNILEYNIEYAGVLIYQNEYDKAFRLLNDIHIDHTYSIRYKALQTALLSNLYTLNNSTHRARELKKEYETLLEEKQYTEQIEAYMKAIK